jgi:hypothetical protein
MKTLFLALTVAGLTGCAVYPSTPAPAYGPYGPVAGPAYVGPAPYFVEPPVFFSGSVFIHDGFQHHHPHRFHGGGGFRHHSLPPNMRGMRRHF